MKTANTEETRWVCLDDLMPVDSALGYREGFCSNRPSRHNYVVQAWSTAEGGYVDTRRGGSTPAQAERQERKLRADKSAWMHGETTGTRVVKAKAKIN